MIDRPAMALDQGAAAEPRLLRIVRGVGIMLVTPRG